MISDFRKDYVKDLPQRAIDFALHVSMAAVIVGLYYKPWYFGIAQWFPDICLLYMWPHGILTRRYLAKTNFVLCIHRALHDLRTLVLVLFLTIFIEQRSFLNFFMFNWFLHLCVDEYTHEDQK